LIYAELGRKDYGSIPAIERELNYLISETPEQDLTIVKTKNKNLTVFNALLHDCM
jgi:hypothetical protein